MPILSRWSLSRARCAIHTVVLVTLAGVAGAAVAVAAGIDRPPLGRVTRDAVAGGADAQETAIIGVTVVDVVAGRLLRDRTVRIVGDRIVAVGPRAATPVPDGVRVLEGNGGYLIPGLWDMHVHVAQPGWDTLSARLFLHHGVTGVRDMFSPSRTRIDRWKARSATPANTLAPDSVPWPRMVASGHILDGPTSQFPGSPRIATPEQGRRAVDSLKGVGADFIKVYNGLSRASYLAVLDEARRVGLPVVGHVSDDMAASEAAAAGLRSMEHLESVLYECSTVGDSLRRELVPLAADTAFDPYIRAFIGHWGALARTYDPARCRRLARTFARLGTWHVPTTVGLHAWGRLDDSVFRADPRLDSMPAGVRRVWDPRNDPIARRFEARDYAALRALLAVHQRIAGELVRAGVRILAGTDTRNAYVFPGSDLHRELEFLVSAGMTPAQALRAATVAPAEFLGLRDSLGTVAVGQRADLVLLDADPPADIRHTTRIRAVLRAGVLVRGKARTVAR